MENATSEARRDYMRKYNQDHRVQRRANARERRHARMSKVSGRALKAAREDPCYEQEHAARDYVICRVSGCGAKAKSVTPGHLMSHHKLTTEQYLRKFPGAPLISLALLQKLRTARPDMRLGRAHRGEKPTRRWNVAKLLVAGKSPGEIGNSIGRSIARVKRIGRKLGLSSRPARYDLGVRLTRAQLAILQKATGLDGPSFASRFGVPQWLTHGKAVRAKQRLSPDHALAIITARDKIISDVYRLAQNKGRGRYTGSSPRVLNSLVPHFPQAIATVRHLLAERKVRSCEDWQNWICEQAATHHDGSISVLPLAIELSPWIEQRLGKLDKRRDLWRLAVEILALRFSVSSSVASEKSRSLPPSEMERLILRLDRDQRATQPGSAAAPAKETQKRNRGRQEGSTSEDTKGRLNLIAALEKLGRPLRSNSSVIYPDAPASAETNTYSLASRNRKAIDSLKEKLTPSEAEALLREAVKLAVKLA